MGPGKRQRSSEGTPGDRQAKRPKQTGQPRYAKVAQEGLRVATVCEDYPETQIPRERFGDIQKDVGRLADGLPEEGFTMQLLDTYWSKGAATMVCQDQDTCDRFARLAPTLMAWEGSRFKVVEMDALPVFKRVTAWFPGPPEDTETLFQRFRRLNRGLEPKQWRVYERKEKPHGVRLVLAALAEREWKAFSGMGRATFSLLGVKLEGKK
jgi:hypothetical protein